MTMDTESRKKLKQFWRKRLWFGLGTVGVLGLGVGTIGLMRSTYDELQFVEGRALPEQFYQQQIKSVQAFSDLKLTPLDHRKELPKQPFQEAPACQAIQTLGALKDPRAIPTLGKLLQDGQSRVKPCYGGSFYAKSEAQVNVAYTAAASALGNFQREDAAAYLKTALTTSPSPEVIKLWDNFAHWTYTDEFEPPHYLSDMPESQIKAYRDKVTGVQKRRILEALGDSSKHDDDWQNVILQALPGLNRQEFSNGYSLGETLALAFQGQENNPQFQATLIKLIQDKKVADATLVDIFNVLAARKAYAQLVDILYIEAWEAGRSEMLSQLNSHGELYGHIAYMANQSPNPKVLQRLISLIHKQRIPQSVRSYFLNRQEYEKVLRPVIEQAERQSTPWGFIHVTPASHIIEVKYDNGNSTQNNYRSLLLALRNSTNEPEANQEQRFLLIQLQKLNGELDSRTLWKKSAVDTAIPALKSALKYPVLRNAGDAQQSEPEGYLTKQWAIPCRAATALIYLGSKEGLEPCLAALRMVAAQQYSTETQRQKIIGGDNEGDKVRYSGSKMIESSEDTKYHFSPLDVAVFRWYNLPEFQGDPKILKPLLITLLKNPDAEVRRAAMFSLSQNSRREDAVTEEEMSSILVALKDSDVIVREYTVRYLRGRISWDVSSARDQMMSVAGFIWSSIGSSSTGAGYKIRNTQFGGSIDTGYYFPYSNVEKYLRQNPQYTQAVMALNQAIQDDNPQVRQATKLVLSDVSHDSNQDFLVNSLQDTQAQIRFNSVNSLCRFGEKMLPSIVDVLKQEPRRDVRMAAVKCLASWVKDSQVNDRRIASALLALLATNPQEPQPIVGTFGNTLTITDQTQYRPTILETFEILADRGQLNLDASQTRQAIPILLKIHQDWSGKSDLTADRARNIRVLKAIYEKFPVDQASQNRTHLLWNLERGFLAGLGITALILLFSSIRLRNPFPLIWSGYLIFPEEIVAELIALKQRRQAENVSSRRIRRELAYEVILLLWAVHVQIRIDNLHLPPGGNDRAK
jgi:HEAT repeat protein